jgi:hypothetical protein
MTRPNQPGLVRGIQFNCDISDAHDHGIYSMCSMVLKLRNLYKWEQGMDPWKEPESADLLDWIEAKENYWEQLNGTEYQQLELGEDRVSPHDVELLNDRFEPEGLFYGAGYGRSMKTVFFLARQLGEKQIEGCRVVILGEELAKEMASPFALVQDGIIVIRRESLRFFFWDQVQELRSSCRSSLRHAYEHYGIMANGALDHGRFKELLDTIVDEQMDLFIYHEVGEILQTDFDSLALKTIIGHFPGSAIEYVCRALKDVLADTHPRGLLAHIIRERRDTTLGFYVGFLDGLREKLFPEMSEGWQEYLDSGDWLSIERARQRCRDNNRERADRIKTIAGTIGKATDEQVISAFNTRILTPLGLDIPAQ